MTATVTMKENGMTRTTFYRRVKKYEAMKVESN